MFLTPEKRRRSGSKPGITAADETERAVTNESKTTIAVVGGTGAMGSGLARAWARAGYRVLIGSRSAERAVEKARELETAHAIGTGALAGASLERAASESDVVVLTVPYASHRETLLKIAELLPGKILVDATVPLKPPKVGRVQLPDAGSAALEAQALLGEGVEVVSAFQNVGAHNLHHADATIECDVLVSGDKAAARDLVIGLARAAGMRAFHAGPLANSVAAEALTSILIGINRRYGYPGAGLRITPGHGGSDAADHVAPRSHAPERLEYLALKDLPEVQAGDDLAAMLVEKAERTGAGLLDHDVLVVASKIVSKAEGRSVRLEDVEPSAEALKLAGKADKDPRLVELILRESSRVLRHKPGVIVVEHRLGLVMANAGIDFSNVEQEGSDGRALLLPEDPDGSAHELRERIRTLAGVELGIVVNDSIGRAWRRGTVGHAIGVAGITPLIDLRGKDDRFGRKLLTSEVAFADELAAAGSVLMGQGAEGRPVVIVRGLSASSGSSTSSGSSAGSGSSTSRGSSTGSGLSAAGASALLRDPAEDLFR